MSHPARRIRELLPDRWLAAKQEDAAKQSADQDGVSWRLRMCNRLHFVSSVTACEATSAIEPCRVIWPCLYWQRCRELQTGVAQHYPKHFRAQN